MSAPAGYSGTPLLQKLGYVPGKISYVDSIAPYFTEVRDDITLNAPSLYDFIHIFVKTPDELQRSANYATSKLAKSGMLWISWPKQTANPTSVLSSNIVRAYGLSIGLVDVKVAAIDAEWSGLKFVYRTKDR